MLGLLRDASVVEMFLLVLVLIWAIGQKLLATEIQGWLPHLSGKIVRAVARRLPGPDGPRYEDEWLSKLASFDKRPLTGLLWALELHRVCRGLRRELGDVAGHRPAD